MGQPAGGVPAQGALLIRSSQPISSHSAPPAPAFVCYLQRRSHPTASAAPPSAAPAALTAGLVRRLVKLHCSSPVRRLSPLCASSYCCSGDSAPLLTTTTTSGRRPHSFDSSSTSSSGLLNLWIPGSTRKMSQDRLHLRRAAADEDINEKPIGTRKVVEHVVLFMIKDSFTEEQEKEMLDNLWSLQYQIKNILCTSVGRLAQKTPEGYTHGLFTRFPNKQALDEYMDSPIRWRVAQDLMIPFFSGKPLFLDFESEVEDDIETIFRRGDDFQEGVEHFLTFRFKDKVSSDAADKFFKIVNTLPAKFGGLVQLTAGANFDSTSKDIYSHGLAARLPSEEGLTEYEKFLQADPSWLELTELFETSETVVANFVVSPIGKTVM